MLTPGTRRWLAQQLPQLAGIAQKTEAAGLAKGRASTRGAAPEDEAVRLTRMASSYWAYVAGFKSMSFLGTSVISSARA